MLHVVCSECRLSISSDSYSILILHLAFHLILDRMSNLTMPFATASKSIMEYD
jgi:hypothetical protein